jgi:hypothetical protein
VGFSRDVTIIIWGGSIVLGIVVADIDTGRCVQNTVSADTGKVRVVRGVVDFIPVGPFPFSVSMVVALIVTIEKSPAALPVAVRKIIALEVGSIGEEEMATTVPVLLYVGCISRVLSDRIPCRRSGSRY